MASDLRERIFLQRSRQQKRALISGLSASAAAGPMSVGSDGIYMADVPDRRIEFLGTGGVVAGFERLEPRTAPAVAPLDPALATNQDIAEKVNEVISALASLGVITTAPL